MDFADVIFALFIIVVAVVSLLSNLLVLLCFVHSSEIRRQVPGVFTMNLSFCNILITVLNMPATLVGVIRDQQPFGDCICHTVSFLETSSPPTHHVEHGGAQHRPVDRGGVPAQLLRQDALQGRADHGVLLLATLLHLLPHGPALLVVDYSSVYASCTLQPTVEGETGLSLLSSQWFSTPPASCSPCSIVFHILEGAESSEVHCKRIDIITMQTLFLLVDIHPSVKQRCLAEQKRRKQRATKKISIFIGLSSSALPPMLSQGWSSFPFVDINRRWGIISKCLTYSKAASDPFAYSLLRQQYKKVLVTVVNRLLRRDLYPSSGTTAL
ncbi:hypothetical protein F7725_004512 [Dissostichus mawsoni]|uniref:G-protein coupled receptors family 1 profile domain-containing protein n=1 Tax=Dissostichus mawsoni TaxID=36200 RepID=A0A7J5XLK2_DISMA|nr:hypothetical protein F7725_004512 [Dissostichus mawsoni]